MPAEKIDSWYDILAAARNGVAEAQQALGDALAHGADGFVVNIKKAVEWHTLAAKQGHVASQRSLAEIYATVPEVLDITKAAYWYERAADGGDPHAREKLAHLKEEHTERRVRTLTRQAESGDTASQYVLGRLYRTEGKIRNIELACFWLTKAAEQNSADAHYELGELYALEEEAHDLLLARCWYEMAAVLGHEKAAERVEVIDLCLKQQAGKTLAAKVACWSEKKRLGPSRVLASLWDAVDAANFVVAYSLLSKLRRRQEI